MKYRIRNTDNWCGELDEKYLEMVKKIFGEIETRKVYREINDIKYYVQSYIEVKSLEQLNSLVDEVGDREIVIYEDDNDYTYIQEVDKFVYIRRDEYPQEMVIEIYDTYRE